MEKTCGVLIWIFILIIFSHVVHAQVCELDPCPAGERCFVRTAFGGTPYVCECTPPRGIGFDCSNFAIPYDELFTCYGRECTSSTFATPDFPSTYPTNYRALFLIFVPGGEEITFQLGFPYDIGPGDFLYVGRGLEFTLTDLFGPSVSGEFYVFGSNDGTFQPFTLLGDAFWLYFVSDGDNSAQAQGFGLLWTARMITDQGPEILNCPQDISLPVQIAGNQIPVTWVEPTSSDPTATSTSNRSPGQAFDVPSTTTVTYTFTNGQGVSTCSFVIAVTLETGDRPPVITNCPQPITEFADDAFSGALINWRAPDVTDDSPGMLEVTQSHLPPEFFAIGEHMVTYTFTDSAGNSVTCSFMVTVIDVTPPSFNNCPSDVSVTATSTNGAVTQWQRPSATDNSAQMTVTSNFEPGDLFSVGVTTVRYTAVDSSGNNAVCQFSVTVTLAGNTGVTIRNCPQDMTVVAENGQTFMVVMWTPPTAQDANGQNIVPTATFQPGSFFRVGTETTVRYTFLSSGGQEEVCSFTVRVVAGVDMGLRVEDCSSDILELAPIGFNFVTIPWTEPTAVDQFGFRYQATGSQMPGSYFEVGTTTRVTYNFMDNAGNTAQCSFLVTVEFIGDQLNVEGCPNIPITETIPVGSSTIQVFWTPPTVSQNTVVGQVQVLSNFQPGDIFPPGETIVTYSFTDSVGSTGLCSFTVIVSQEQDTTPPTVSNCPTQPIERTVPAGTSQVTVTWTTPTATDASGIASSDVNFQSGSTFSVGATTVRYTFVDGAGNSAFCVFDVVVLPAPSCLLVPCDPPTVCINDRCVVDNEPPTVRCPDNILRSIPLTDVCTQITWQIPFVNDNSGGVVIAVSAPVSGTCFMVNSVTNVVVTAMDPSGNANSCQFTVTVNELDIVDNIPPFVLCPNDIRRNIPVEQGCSEVTWMIPFVQDDSGEVTATSVPPPGTCFNQGITSVVVTAVDPSGNTDVCDFMVEVVGLDFEPPTLICPDDILREIPVTDECVVVNWEVPFVSDNSGGMIEVVSTPESGTCFFVGTTSNVLVTAEDPQGNSARCQFVVTVTEIVVIDTTPPTVICPTDIIQDRPVEQPCIQVTWQVPFSSDNSGGSVSVASTPISGSCISDATTVVTVTATDPSGNENTCNFIIRLNTVDNEPPTVICPNDISRNIPISQLCMEVSWMIPFFSDNSGDPVLTSTPPSGTCLAPGETEVTVTATDPSGNENSCNFVVNLITLDTEPPSLQCPADISQTIVSGQQCAEVTWQIPFFSDNSGQDVTITSVPPSGTCFSDMGTVVTVTALDPSNNVNTCTFVVRINQIDTEPPSLQCPEDISQTIVSGQQCAEVTWQIPFLSDNSGQDVTTISVPPSGTCFSDMATVVTVTALDPSNNVNTCTFVVTISQIDSCSPNPCFNGGTCISTPTNNRPFTCLCVAGFIQSDCSMDTQPPSVACPQDISVTLATGETCAVATWEAPQASDNSGGNVIVVSSPQSGTCFVRGTTTVQVTASDQSGNFDQCTFDVNVIQQDTTPPTVVCPQNMAIVTNDDCVVVEWTIPFAFDTGGGQVNTMSNPPSGTCFEIGVIEVVVTATDASDNIATCSFSVAVTADVDNIPPVVICPQSRREMLVEGSCVTVEWVVPFSSDDQGGPVTETSDPQSGSCFEVGRTDVTITAVDGAGNSATCDFFVEITQIVDNTPPVVQNCPTGDVEVTLPLGESCTPIIWMEPTAVDQDGQPPMVMRFPSQPDCFSAGEILFTYIFTDQASNIAFCIFTVVITPGQVVDNTNPTVLTCPSNVNGEITTVDGCAEVTWTPPIATDDSVGALQGESNFEPGSCFIEGSTTVTYTFTDPSGNMAICTFEVVVMLVDDEPPVVTRCPEDISLEALSNSCTQVNWIEPQAVDNIGLMVTVETDFTPGQCFPLGMTTVIYTFRDPSGNTAVCRFVVTITNPQVVDTEPPMVLNCPRDITDQAGPDNSCTRVFWNEPFALDAVSGLAEVTQNFAPGDCFNVGVRTVIYTFTDASGNSEICQFTITINIRDFVPPDVINCPDDITLQGQSGTTCTSVSWTVPTAIDNLPGEIDTFASSSPGDCFPAGPTTVVYQYTDVAGNTASCMFTIVILVDNAPPVITSCPTDISQQAAPGARCAMIFWSEPVAIDAESGVPSLERNFIPGMCFNVGTTEVVYTFTDTAGNEAVCRFQIRISQVIDFTPPVIRNCPSDITIPGVPGNTCQTVVWVTPTATDDVPGDVTVTSSANPGDCFPFVPTMVTYTFTDAAGNSASCAFIVTIMIVDTIPPQVSNCPSDIFLQAPAGATCQSVVWVEPTAVDENGGAVFTQSTQSPGDCLPFGTNIVTYTFSDTGGNSAVCRFTVSITPRDNNPPVISNCPQDIRLESPSSSGCQNVIWIEPTATDDTSVPSLRERSHAPGQCFPEGSTVVTYQFVDLEGNVATCSFVVTVIFRDTDPPTVTGCPMDMTVQAIPGETCAFAQWTEPIATDNGNGEIMIMRTSQPGSCFSIGNTLVSYIFTDGSGNVAACTFTINVFVLDVIPPTITNCPSDITLDAISNNQCASVSWIEPGGIDESEGPVTIRSQTHFPGDCFPIGPTVVTYVLQDTAGNTATCTFTITINRRDVTPPEVIICPNDISLEIVSDSQCVFANWQEPLFIDDSPIDQVTITQTAFSGECIAVGTQTVVYTFTDAAGNSATCSFIVEITRRDTTPPVVSNCPSDITLSKTPNLQCVAVTWIEPTATDESPPITTEVTDAPGSCFTEGTTIVTYSFQDAFGNTEFCSFTVLIQILDNTPPDIIVCPSDIIQTISPPATCAEVSFPLPTAVDDSQVPVNVIPSHAPGDCFNVGMTSISYIFIDSSGNLATCMFSIQVNLDDTLSPVITACPSNIMLILPSGQTCITAAWIPPTATDESGPVTSTVNVNENMCFPLGQNDVIYTFRDEAGNSATCLFQVIVRPGVDNTPPVVVSCPDSLSIMLPPGQTCVVINFIEPVATDDSGTVLISSQSVQPNECFQAGVTQVVYVFQDPSGNEARCEFTITILSPDPCTLNPCFNGGTCIPTPTNNPPFTCLCLGGFAQSDCSMDTQPPSIVCPQDVSVTLAMGETCAVATWEAPQASDNGGDNVIIESSFQSGTCFDPGTTIVEVTASDQSGNSNQCTFNVNVLQEANTPPSTPVCPTVPPVTGLAANVGNLVTWTIGDCTDTEDGAITPVCNPMSGTFFDVGTNPVVCTCTDSGGLSTECTFDAVVVGANTPPSTPVCPTETPVTSFPGNIGNVVTWTIGDCTDTEDGAITPVCNPMSGTFFNVGTNPVVCTCTDSGGLSTECTFDAVVVGANTPPSIPVCPTETPVTSFPGNIGNVVAWTIGDCTDTEDGAVTPVCNPMSGTFLDVGNNPVVCTCTDSGGLSTECTFDAVVVGANTPPSIPVCPTETPVTSFPGNIGNVVTWTIGDCTDTEDGAVTPVCNPMSGTFFNVGTNPVVCTCTDSGGLSTECTFDAVVVGANTPPSTPVCPTISPVTGLAANVGNLVTWTIGDCTDTEDGAITPVCNPMSGTFFNVGTNPVVCTCTDSGGLSTECTFDAVVLGANTPPSIPVCPTVPPVTGFAANVGNFVMWTIGDCTDMEDGTITPVCNPMSNTFFNVGTNPVVCTCTDSGGLSTECTFDAVVVGANTPPSTPVCPTIPPVTSIPGNEGNMVSWTIGDCTDAEDGAVTPVCNPLSNAFFNVGTTPVVCTCTDSGGLSTECTFDAVVVGANTPPSTPVCPVVPPVTSFLGNVGNLVTWTIGDCTDAEDGAVTPVCNPMSNTFFNVGTNPVVCTCTDSGGLSSECTFDAVVTGVNNPPSTPVCPTVPPVISFLGNVGNLVTWTIADCTDAEDGTVTPVCNPMSNTFFNVGTNPVVCTCTDSGGLSTECTFDAVVEPVDATPPEVMNCPTEDIVHFVQAGMTIPVTWMEPTATDNSGQDVIITQNASPGDSFPIGSFRVTYTFSDQANNLAPPCQFLINVIEDNVPPDVMGCPQSFFATVSLAEGGQVIMWNEPTAVDNSGRPVVVQMTGRVSGTFFEVGTNENIVYTFTDEAGNSATCIFTVNVALSTDPLNIENCPMDLTLSAEPGQISTVASWTIPTATGVMPITVAGPTQQPGDQILFGTTEIVYRFTDGNNQMADCRFTIMVLVTPLILNCPTSFALDAPPGSTGTLVTWTEPTPMGVEPFMTAFPETRPNTFLPAGDTVITYTFTDNLGQEVTCQFTVTVNVLDSPPIVIADCPVDFTVDAQPGESTVVATWTIPSATGFEPVFLTAIAPFTPGVTPLPVGMDVTLTYSFTDGLGMTADCTFTITPRDITSPSFVINCPTSPVIQFIGPTDENTVVMWTVPMAIDDIPGGMVTAVVTPNSDIFTAGNTPVTYTFSDAAGNSIMCDFVVSVIVDNMPPVVMFCPLDITVNADPTLNGQSVSWGTPTAIDNVELSPNVEVTGGISNTVFPVGVATIMYRFSDIFGNTADCIFTVEVIGDTTLPVISGCPLEPVTGYTAVGVPSTVNWVPPTATDTGGGMITTTNTHFPNESLFPPGTTAVTYTFTDASGNAATCVFQVMLLEDSIPPTVENCPPDILIDLEPGMTQSTAQWIAPTGTDNSNLAVTVERDGPPSGSQFPIGNTFITYTLTDSVGLTSSCTFAVSVRDVTAPQILNCPTEDLVRYAMTVPLTVELPVLLVTDDTGVMPTLISSNAPAQNMFPVGSSLLAFVYTDVSGNFATCSFTVVVIVDNTAPVVVCPDTVQVFVPVGVATTPVNYPNPTVTDDSGLTPTLVSTIGIASGDPFPAGTTSFVSFQYQDAAGNQGSCTLQVTVTVDTTPPTITSCTDTAMAFASSTNTQAFVTFAEPTATDDSGLAVTMTVEGLGSGSFFPAGVSTTVYLFMDSVGNSAVCQTVVTVDIDVTPPTIMDCPTNIVMTVPNTATQLMVTFTAPTATDNSGEDTRLTGISGVAAGSMYPVGVTVITYTFEDNYGNSAMCQFTITITQEVCNPSPCAANEVCTSDGGNPPMAVCTFAGTPCESNPCNPDTEFCLEIMTGFLCVSLDMTSPVVAGCPATAVTETVPTTTALPVLVVTPVPTATDDSNQAPTVTVTGLPAGNAFPEGSTDVTYTFTDGANNQATCSFSVIVDVDYCLPNPCPGGTVCTEGSPNPSQVVCAGPCESNPCNPFFQLCLELNDGGFVCAPNGNTPTIPEVIDCPTSDMTQTIDTTVPLPVFFNAPVPTTTTAGATVAITGVPTGNLFPEGNTLITYTFTSPDGGQATCSFSIIIDVDYCTPNPCVAGMTCTEGSPVPAQVVCAVVDVCSPTPCLANQICVLDNSPQGFFCADQCVDATTCPGQYCFNSIGLMTGSPCVNSLTNPSLGNCPPETLVALAPFGTNAATVVLPVPFLLDFPTYPVTVNQVPAGDSFNVGDTNFFQFITDDVRMPISICQRRVTVTAAPTAGFMLSNCDEFAFITRYVAGGTTGVQVFFDEPSTVGGQGTVSLSVGNFRSGSIFPVGGITGAMFTFMDETPSTLECSRFVDVIEDTTAPTISGCTPLIERTVESTTTSIVVTISPPPTAVDNNNLPVTVTQVGFPDNNLYVVGTTMVSYVFTDSVGNAATCSITVTIDQDFCNPDPCPAGQACAEDMSMQGFSCTVTNPCDSSPCPAGQSCFEFQGAFVCDPGTGRRKRSIHWRDEDSRQRRYASSSDDLSSDDGSSSNIIWSYIFVISVSIVAILSTAVITAWYHRKKSWRGQRSRETASSII